MNRHERAVTNERLYCCRLQLDWYAQQLNSGLLAPRILEIACGEGLKSQLMTAYHSYLVELCATYNWPVTSFNTAVDLKEATVSCAELSELLVLEREDSWLSRLLDESCSVIISDTSLPASGGDIQLFQASSQQSLLSIEELQSCYLSLKKLIDKHRSHSEEW